MFLKYGLMNHGSMFGAVEFYEKARGAGVKPLLGCEVYVAARSRHDKEKRERDAKLAIVTEKDVAADVQVRAETLVIEPGEERTSIVFGAEATLRKRYVPYAANVGDIGVRIAGGPVVRIPIEPAPLFRGARP